MNNMILLELLRKGRVEEAICLLEDEIYQNSLDTKSGAKKRYSAMKKYFTYHQPTREALKKPCFVEYEGKTYTSFCNAWSLVLTTEDAGEIELYDNSSDNYPDVIGLLRFDGIKKKIDFNKVIAEAKSKGYRLNKKEVGPGFNYLMLYDGTYYKIGLLDITYGVINDGEPVLTYHPDGEKMPLVFQNDLGMGILMPVFMTTGEVDEKHIIIEVE